MRKYLCLLLLIVVQGTTLGQEQITPNGQETVLWLERALNKPMPTIRDGILIMGVETEGAAGGLPYNDIGLRRVLKRKYNWQLPSSRPRELSDRSLGLSLLIEYLINGQTRKDNIVYLTLVKQQEITLFNSKAYRSTVKFECGNVIRDLSYTTFSKEVDTSRTYYDGQHWKPEIFNFTVGGRSVLKYPDGLPHIYHSVRQLMDNEKTRKILGQSYFLADTASVLTVSLGSLRMKKVKRPLFATASSTLNPPSSTYKPENVFDEASTTAWAEGVEGHGEGEWLELDFGKGLERTGSPLNVVVVNGYAWTKAIWAENTRIAKMEVQIADHLPVQITLQDTIAPQTFTLCKYWDSRGGLIRFKITEVYPGAKYQDTCLSEILVYR